MMIGCSSTTNPTVCEEAPKVYVPLSMRVTPREPVVMPQHPSKGEALSIATENNEIAKETREQLKAILEWLSKQEGNK